MKMGSHGKEDVFKVGVFVEHCHVKAALTFEIAPEALLTATPDLEDSSERMNTICTRATQAVTEKISQEVALLHSEFLQSLERAEVGV